MTKTCLAGGGLPRLEAGKETTETLTWHRHARLTGHRLPIEWGTAQLYQAANAGRSLPSFPQHYYSHPVDFVSSSSGVAASTRTRTSTGQMLRAEQDPTSAVSNSYLVLHLVSLADHRAVQLRRLLLVEVDHLAHRVALLQFLRISTSERFQATRNASNTQEGSNLVGERPRPSCRAHTHACIARRCSVGPTNSIVENVIFRFSWAWTRESRHTTAPKRSRHKKVKVHIRFFVETATPSDQGVVKKRKRKKAIARHDQYTLAWNKGATSLGSRTNARTCR